MKNVIKFTVFGEAVSRKNKMGINKYTKKPYMYKAKDSSTWEESVTGQAIKHRPVKLITGAVKLGATFYRKIPKSMSKKKRAMAISGELRPTSKPDVDNLLKSFKDSLTGLVWCDDALIVEYKAGTGKWYAETPRVDVVIEYDE